MHTVVDQFGRIVIPKLIRDHLGLIAGTQLEIKEFDHQIMLKVQDDEPLTKNVGGVLIYTGKASGDLVTAIQQHRASHIKHKSGF
jgi:AbrB family looped-hinge helix DNA binding protein